MSKDVSAAREIYVVTSIQGASGHGKTSLINQYVMAADAGKRRVLIVDHKRQWPQYHKEPLGELAVFPPKWDGDNIVAVWPGIDHIDDYMRALIDEGDFHGMLALDDADLYLSSSARGPWREIFASYRHLGYDVVVNTRRPQEVPKLLFASLDYLCLFKQKDRRAREHLQAMTDHDLSTLIPQVPYRYLLIDLNSESAPKVYRTQKMAHSDELAANRKGLE